MQSYYLLTLLCLTFCAVAKCEITTGLDCQTEKLVGVDYCPDGAPANYDGHSARHHCCSKSLRQGKCPGECRKLRSKRSMKGPSEILRTFFGIDDEGTHWIPLTLPIPNGIPIPMNIPVPEPDPAPKSTPDPLDIPTY